MRIAIHGQLYLRPPGLDPYVPPGYYGDQEQTGTPAHVDETFVQDEDEEGFVLSELEEEPGDEELEELEELEEEEYEDEELEDELQVPLPPYPSSFVSKRKGEKGVDCFHRIWMQILNPLPMHHI